MSARVLLVTAEYPPVRGGIADYAQNLADALVRTGVAVTVLTSAGADLPAAADEQGVRVMRTMPDWRLRDLPRVLRAVDDCGAGTVVHVQYPGVAFRRNPMVNLLPAYLRARRPRTPVALTVHDARVMRRRWRARMAPMLAAARAVLHVDPPDGEYVRRWTWLNRPATACVPIGASVLPVPVTPADRQAWRDELGLAGEQPVVAFLGMLYAHKGLRELVEAVVLLRAGGRLLRLLVIGDFDRETAFEAEVTELLGTGREEGWVVWLRGAGAASVSRALRAADLAALPLYSGAASNRSSLLSALAHGLPTVTTRGHATPPEFGERFPVTLVPPRDAEALARGIGEELELNRAADPAFHRRCAEIIPAWDDVAARHVEIYAALAAPPGERLKILQVHVRHVNPGGSEVMFEALVHALSLRGHEVDILERDNAEIRGVLGRAGAAIHGIYSFPARREMGELLRRERPDVVHLHNVYPLLSPSVVDACREAGVPVVMSLHDYKLICPTAQNFRAGAPCHRCSGGREHHCVLTNCRGTMVESIAYAARTAAARRAGWFTRGVERFIACSDFVRDRHVEEGFPAARIEVIPNFAEIPPRLAPRDGQGSYAAFIGRLSAEKGLETLVEAARQTGIPIHVAGSGADSSLAAELPANVRLVGRVPREKLAEFLTGARFLVVPSRFEEPFGLVAAEAMGHGVAVIAARTGGLAEVVDDGVTGLLFASGDAAELADAMMQLWKDPALAAELGAAGREKAMQEYDKETYCTKLESVYESVARVSASPIRMRA